MDAGIGDPAVFALCVISANVPSLGRTVLLPTVESTMAIVVLMPLLLVFLSAAGALVSLRSATVRHAQSKLIVLLMGLWFGLALPFFALCAFVRAARRGAIST